MAQKAIRTSSIYLVISVVLGMYIGIAHNFSTNLISVHAHLMFVGWIFFSFIGIVYFFFPEAGKTSLAKWAFVIENIGLVIWMIGVLLEMKSPSYTSVAGLGAAIAALGLIMFSVNVWQGVKANH